MSPHISFYCFVVFFFFFCGVGLVPFDAICFDNNFLQIETHCYPQTFDFNVARRTKRNQQNETLLQPSSAGRTAQHSTRSHVPASITFGRGGRMFSAGAMRQTRSEQRDTAGALRDKTGKHDVRREMQQAAEPSGPEMPVLNRRARRELARLQQQQHQQQPDQQPPESSADALEATMQS